ncbi:hypothetical protein [Dactylosporangium sp. NPDC051541]|uniref:hypothetical protein n=1 Tax=Dactylosporangium sp. NPDC051541 TaxID=3363977 RepID=UPI00378954F4
MTLADRFIDFAEEHYAVDWAAIQRSVAARLRVRPSFDATVYDPRRYPSYWCVPVLVGGYLGASRRAVLLDTEAFVGGCVLRHHLLDPERPFDAEPGPLAGAYDGCRLGAGPATPFDARFAAKCRPWTVLLATGTEAILAETDRRADYDAALAAIVLVHSCLQIIDDWHDREEDLARAHWNMWVHEPLRDTLAVITPLVRGAGASIRRLRPHLLRTALDLQLRDTTAELADVVARSRATT